MRDSRAGIRMRSCVDGLGGARSFVQGWDRRVAVVGQASRCGRSWVAGRDGPFAGRGHIVCAGSGTPDPSSAIIPLAATLGSHPDRRATFTLFLGDGRVAIDNNAAERAMRPIGIGREPPALRRLRHRRRDPRPRHDPRRDRQHERPRAPGPPRRPARPHPRPRARRLDELFPWNWTPTPPVTQDRAA